MESARTPTASRVFVDSSVVIAAAVSARGAARELILAALQSPDRIALCTSALVLQETERNLWRKAPQAVPAFQAFQSALLVNLV